MKLPKEFKKYFWDVDFEKLSMKKHFNLILSRLMNFGNISAIRWLLKNVNKNVIKNYLLTIGSCKLDRRSLNFWKLVFGLPSQKKPVNPFWPY